MPHSLTTTPTLNSPLMTWLNYLGTIHVSAIDMGLNRVLPVAHNLGLIETTAKVFTVAGTNGKGSTTATISAITAQADYKTGLYQSPHVFNFNERIQINNKPVPDQVIIEALYAVNQARLALSQSLSFFETTTLAALLIFKEAACAVWVLEIGLGGRLDVVNIIAPDVAVITNIGIDHIDWLGDDKEIIGYEKAGILRPKIPCVLAHSAMPASVWQKIRELDCTTHIHTIDYDFKELNAKKNTETIEKKWLYSNKAVTLQLPLPSLALENVSAGITATLASGLTVTQEQIAMGLKSLNLMGRYYQGTIKLADNAKVVPIIADAVHNPDGMQFLLKQLHPMWQQHCSIYPQAKLHIVFSVLADKQITAMVQLVHAQLEQAVWHIAPLQAPRAADMSVLEAPFLSLNINNEMFYKHDTIKNAIQNAYHNCTVNDKILICGSFHTIAEALSGISFEL